MQGTVLTTLLQQSRDQARHPRRQGADQEYEDVSSRFSMLSTSSNITDTSFAFDQEALNSNIYRQAFKQRMRNLVSLPQKFRGDRTSRHAVLSLAENASYYNEAIEDLEETALPESAESVVTVDNPTDPATEDKTFDMKSHLSSGTEIFEDHVSPNNPLLNNAEAKQEMADLSLDPSNTLKQEKFVPAQPHKVNKPAKESLWGRLLRSPTEQIPSKHSDALASRTKKPSVKSLDTHKVKLDPRSLYFASANNFIKLVVVGDSGPLKTLLLIVYTTQKYPSEYTPTVFDNYSVSIMVGNEKWTLGCWDTAGQEKYDRLRPLSYPQTDVFLICANRARLNEYESAKHNWIPELNHHKPHIPKILVGVEDFEDDSKIEEIPIDRTEYGTKLAKEMRAEKYLECDLRTMKGVKEVFEEAIATALARVLTKEELRREKKKEEEARNQAPAAAKKPMEGIKENPEELSNVK